jgi:hypothetical protein
MTARCSNCEINYPSHFMRCQVCDEGLSRLTGEEPDFDWQYNVHLARNGQPITARTTAEQVEDWRLEQLLDAGYDIDAATNIAKRPWHEVDLHQAVDVIRNGCPPELAAEIFS